MLHVRRISIDLDSHDQLCNFAQRLIHYRNLLTDVEHVVFEKTNHGYHILLILKHPISLRDNLALRLLLLDDAVHVAYDLFASLYSPRFPTNVLFTKKFGKQHEKQFEGSLDGFIDFLHSKCKY